jgi:hypothetical protein
MKQYANYLIVLAVVFASSRLYGQNGTGQPRQGIIEAAASYKFSYANTTTPQEFWQNGGSIEVHGQFWKGLGAVGRMDALHTSNMAGTGVGLDLVTTVFGPRYTWSPRASRFRYFGEVLGGFAKGSNSLFPTPMGMEKSANGTALLLGGGVNWQLRKYIGIRVLDVHWMRTDFPNATTGNQNTLVAGSGLVFRLP